ncbi:MAG: RNA polymerase sigma-70 factor (ECF subfamily) [Pirellulaceae bacterium]|jgi:RNA polymerase sigma-70 factor (ECF subfamily)
MDKTTEADEWLMGQVALGKCEYLETLLRRYASPLLTYIERMVGNHHRSEELFQEVFFTVWLKRKQYKFPKRFRSWLYTIAANRCRQDYRKAKLATTSIDQAPDMVPAAVGGFPVEAAIKTEHSVIVAQAVTQLPQQQRTVVVLRIWNGLSYAEIAEVLR